ncbi:MAG: orotidine-5'-phosphate decarboxylase [Candidatus Eisenbacteria bacterium]
MTKAATDRAPRRPETALDRLIVALDFPDGTTALEMVDRLGDAVRWYKVGMELFYAEGPAFLGALRERRKRIFLDLKLHDIPNTMASAVRSLAAHGVDLTTVHVPAGIAALEAVSAAAEERRRAGGAAPLLIGVTRLTSLAPPNPERPWDDVVALAGDAVRAGLDGWVAPVDAAAPLRSAHGPKPVLVCPGIRLPEGEKGDQVAVGTPEAAVAGGADWIVVGRPITRAEDPAQVARTMVERMNGTER